MNTHINQLPFYTYYLYHVLYIVVTCHQNMNQNCTTFYLQMFISVYKLNAFCSLSRVKSEPKARECKYKAVLNNAGNYYLFIYSFTL